jgi:hypothetical protein
LKDRGHRDQRDSLSGDGKTCDFDFLMRFAEQTRSFELRSR